VALVSNGDFVSGSALGAYSRGEYIVRVINAVGYDYLTLGNHEFDYQIPQLHHFVSTLTAQTLCCNFQSTASHKPVFQDYAIRKFGRVKVAFIGVTTPSTPSSSSPIYFKDSQGHFAYTFCQDSLVEVIQHRVDRARRQGADYVVLLSHIGDDDVPPTSPEIIARTSGISVVLDGHSHSTIPQRKVVNRVGDTVLLSSTGTAFVNIGCLIIDADGHVSTRLIPTKEIVEEDKKVARVVDAVRAEYRQVGERHVGVSHVEMPSADVDRGRITRFEETALGDFCADAFRHILDADIGWCNGGAFRKGINRGELTFNDLYSVFPFNNKVLKASLSGQDIADALEAASALLPHANGRFAQVSGLRYTVDTSVASSVIFDSVDVFVSVSGARRVSDIQVLNRRTGHYEPLAYDQRYTIASTDYVLLLMGAGMVFPSLRIEETARHTDAQTIEQYLVRDLGGVIPTRYATLDDRITIKGR
ncbi:MAG: bifunctional metallophosphatase/5'-nucleotidase, partial [Bacteroidales bacterium]|nr:bifunctional metallophosphatase/5'-nucleotidase [Bacteroidales bacterium]